MNYCISCGNELIKDATFCSKCGWKVGDVKVSNANESQAISSVEVKDKLTNTYESAKETVQKSEYVHYFMETLKRPTSALGSNVTTYGWLQIVLFAIAATLSMYSILSGIIKLTIKEISITSMFGIDDEIFRLLRSELVPRLFLVNLVIFITFVVAAFLVLKMFGRSKQTISQMLTEFGGLFTPNIILLLSVSIITLFFASGLIVGISAVILSLSFILCFVAYNFYLYSRVESKTLDKMYVLLISNFVILFLLGLLVYIQVEPIITLLEQLEYQIGRIW